jgi:hypothetical protein
MRNIKDGEDGGKTRFGRPRGAYESATGIFQCTSTRCDGDFNTISIYEMSVLKTGTELFNVSILPNLFKTFIGDWHGKSFEEGNVYSSVGDRSRWAALWPRPVPTEG